MIKDSKKIILLRISLLIKGETIKFDERLFLYNIDLYKYSFY